MSLPEDVKRNHLQQLALMELEKLEAFSNYKWDTVAQTAPQHFLAGKNTGFVPIYYIYYSYNK